MTQYESEEWKSVGFNDSYEVSSHGRIRNKDGDILKCHLNSVSGLYCKTFPGDVSWVISRLVLTVFDRPGLDGEHAIYGDMDRSNLHISNLSWNKVNPNRTPAGETSRKRKVIVYDVDGEEKIFDSTTEASEGTGIHPSNVSKFIKSGKPWKGFTFEYHDMKGENTCICRSLDGFIGAKGGYIYSDGRIQLPSGRWAVGKEDEPRKYSRIEVNGKKHDIHILVAKVFLHTPDDVDKNIVNHINEKKWDNRVENLEYVTRSDNQKKAFASGSIKPPGEKPVKLYRYDKDQDNYTFVEEFKSMCDASVKCSKRIKDGDIEGCTGEGFTDGAVRKSCSKKVEELGKARKFAKSEFFKTHAFRKDGEEL